MTTSKFISAPAGSAIAPVLGRLGRALAGQRGVLVLAAVALGLGAALNWSWLVAAGIAPVLLSVLPCIAMCALGLCMNRMFVASDGHAVAERPTGSAASSAAPDPAETSCCSATRLPGPPSEDAQKV